MTNMASTSYETRDYILRQLSAMRTERSELDPYWRRIARMFMPRAGAFPAQAAKKGDQHLHLLDHTGIVALETLASGLQSHLTNQSRPWMRLTTDDPELAKYAPVKQWLHDCADIVLSIFAKGNTYRTLHMLYKELAAFGTASSILAFDYDDVVRHYPQTIGQFYIATDYRSDVSVFAREYDATVRQVVERFGLKNCSTTVKNLYDNSKLDQKIKIIHMIYPRSDRDTESREAKHMPYASCYLEEGSSDGLLEESGFKQFPALSPRWIVDGCSTYGSSPGMAALGHAEAVQMMQLRKAQVVDYKSRPPLQVPTILKTAGGLDTLPGGITYFDEASPRAGIRSQFEVNITADEISREIADARNSIMQSFHADLFRMPDQMLDKVRTATEIAQRQQDKMLLLGPVVDRLHNELLKPLVDITFVHALEAGLFPRPPEELAGAQLSIEYMSILAQAQKASSTASVDRFVSAVGVVSQLNPGVLDNIDVDKWAEEYADLVGINPSMIVPSKDVAIIRQQRAQQQSAAAMAQAQLSGAGL